MNKLNAKQLFLLYCGFFMFTLMACQPSKVDENIVPETAIVNVQVTHKPSPTITVVATSIPVEHPLLIKSPTATPILSPTIAITISTLITSTALPTLQPTLSSEEAMDILDSWFNEPPCSLPCWWNIYPGQTNWIEANQQLNYLGLEGSSQRNRDQNGEFHNIQYVNIEYPEDKFSNHSFAFYFDSSDILLDISHQIRGQGVKYFPLSLFLTQYGQPDEIMMSVIFDTSSGSVPFRFVLGYWQKGIAVVYEDIVPGEKASQWTSHATGCFAQIDLEDSTPYMEIFLWDPHKAPYKWEDMGNLLFVGSDFPYLSLIDATGISTQQFYLENVSNLNPVCVQTPIDLWENENFYWCEGRKQIIPITEQCMDS